MTIPISRPSRQGGKWTPRVNYTGRRVGRFTVLGPGDRASCFTWTCRCECGREQDIPSRYMAQYARAGSGCMACVRDRRAA